jgi:hypothetical protein
MLVKDLRSRGLKSRSDPCGAAIDSRLSRRCFRAAGRNLPGSAPGSTPFGRIFRFFSRDDGSTGVPRRSFSRGTRGRRERRRETGGGSGERHPAGGRGTPGKGRGIAGRVPEAGGPPGARRRWPGEEGRKMSWVLENPGAGAAGARAAGLITMMVVLAGGRVPRPADP